MDNNELNNNTNNQSNIGGEILMGDAPVTNLNANMQPQNNLNLNQGINTAIQNNLSQAQPTQEEPQSDNIFPEVGQPSPEPIQPVQEPVAPQPIQQPTVEPTSQPTQEPLIPETPKDKKGKGPVIIILLLLVVLGLAGYIVYNRFIPKEDVENTTKTQTKEVTKKVLLKDENLDIVYSDIDEKHEGLVKRVPYINIDSKYAEEINNELKTMVNKGLDGQASNTSYTVDYQYYENGEIISIKFSWQMEGEQTTSKIYNINKYTGKKVTNTEILQQAKIIEKNLNNILVESYKKARPLESIEGNADTPVKDCYQKDLDTLSNGKIKAMYLGNNNELCVLFDVNYVAGAGMMEAVLNVTSNKIFLNPAIMK